MTTKQILESEFAKCEDPEKIRAEVHRLIDTMETAHQLQTAYIYAKMQCESYKRSKKRIGDRPGFDLIEIK